MLAVVIVTAANSNIMISGQTIIYFDKAGGNGVSYGRYGFKYVSDSEIGCNGGNGGGSSVSYGTDGFGDVSGSNCGWNGGNGVDSSVINV